MTSESGASLLGFLDAPVLVGDPEGQAVYANPAFEQRFGVRAAALQGRSLASLFSGGARERVLQAVATVCDRGRAMRFLVREGGSGYWVLVSPICKAGEGLGVILLLTEESPTDDLSGAPPAGAEESPRTETGTASGGGFDPVRALRAVSARFDAEFRRRGAQLDVLVPNRLPAVAGDTAAFEPGLAKLLGDRAGSARRGEVFTLSARSVGEGDAAYVLVALVEPGRHRAAAGAEVDRLRRLVESIGGRLHRLVDCDAGLVTALAFPLAA